MDGLPNNRTLITSFAAAAGFGILYNSLIGQAQRRGYENGFTALYVVAGVASTLIIAARLITLPRAIITGLVFVASGTPMILGSFCRYIRKRNRDEQLITAHCREQLHGYTS